MHSVTSLASDWINCRFKASLKFAGSTGEVPRYEALCRELDSQYRQLALQQFIRRFESGSVHRQPSSLTSILHGADRLALDVTLTTDTGVLLLHAVELVPSASGRRTDEIVPICFSRSTTITKNDRLLAGIAGAILSEAALPVRSARIIHGPNFSSTKLVLEKPVGPTRILTEARSLLSQLRQMVRAEAAAPRCVLNSHCAVCEFQERCRSDAEQRDDLSLLRGLSPAEVHLLNERGIFTVTQLAYTFRAKGVGRNKRQPKRHSQPLQAMAVRDKTVYIRRKPEFPVSPVVFYLDVEGIPERNFDYLVGMLVVDGSGQELVSQLWADSEADERHIWLEFVRRLEQLPGATVLHFGRYEAEFVERMAQRYGTGSSIGADELLSQFHDVYRAIHTNVFFPVYSNSLKSIGTLLGAHWEGPLCSGLDSIVWRHRWEHERKDETKNDLLRYNLEDCRAVRLVTEFLSHPSSPPTDEHVAVETTEGLGNPFPANFGNSRFAIPELREITKCAYFGYQHDKIFFRTDENVRKSVRRKSLLRRKEAKANQRIEYEAPDRCPRCSSERIHLFKSQRFTKLVKDIRFTNGGVKRWVVEHSTCRYQCKVCRHTFHSPGYPTGGPKFGRNLACWAVYQHVALRQPYQSVIDSICDLFGYTFGQGLLKSSCDLMARQHLQTEATLLERLRLCNVICADEAKVQIKGGSGYVWAFSNAEEVVYRYSPSREGAILSEVLGDFGGVLVSDFYGAYDSVNCLQQKCLVHLIRDINDDLVKTPFDTELKLLAEKFTALLRPMIDAIDRYGLRQRHLRRFVRGSERYMEWLARREFESRAARQYQKRIGKYGDRLFTFLSHDGVPWNNNLAENAVKLIVSRRRIMGASFSEHGIRDYLLFLSLFQTLRRKGGSFLRFLLSDKTNLFEFLEIAARRRMPKKAK